MTAATVASSVKVKAEIRALIPPEWAKDEAFLNLVKAIHSVAYMKLAVHSVGKYMEYRRVDEVQKLVYEEPRIIEKQLMGHLSDEKNTIRNGSKRVELAPLKKLFALNDVMLNWDKIRSVIGKRERSKNRAYRIEEIRQILRYAPDLRARVIILLLASTGMRIEGLANLKIGNLKAIEHGGYKLFAITVYDGEPEAYVTFCTPECAKAIDEYLEFRRRIKEPLSKSAPLIRNAIDIETAARYPKKRVAKPVRVRGVAHILNKVIHASGIKLKLEKTIEGRSQSNRRYEVHESRGFRKFFFHACVQAKVEPIHREFMMGHLGGSERLDSSTLAMIYDSPEETDFVKSYMRVVDALTISEENRLTKKLQEKRAIDETNLRHIVAQMVHNYMSRRTNLVERHDSMTEEEWVQQMEKIEELNPLEKLGIDRAVIKDVA